MPRCPYCEVMQKKKFFSVHTCTKCGKQYASSMLTTKKELESCKLYSRVEEIIGKYNKFQYRRLFVEFMSDEMRKAILKSYENKEKVWEWIDDASSENIKLREEEKRKKYEKEGIIYQSKKTSWGIRNNEK